MKKVGKILYRGNGLPSSCRAFSYDVTRTDIHRNVWGPKQRIRVEEALRVATINGAHALFEEKLKGSIEVGKLADLAVLGWDLLREDRRLW